MESSDTNPESSVAGRRARWRLSCFAEQRQWNASGMLTMPFGGIGSAERTSAICSRLFPSSINIVRRVGSARSLTLTSLTARIISSEEAGSAWMRTPPDHRSEEHTSELQSLMRISYAVFCLKKKKNTKYIKLVAIHSSNKNTATNHYIT